MLPTPYTWFMFISALVADCKSYVSYRFMPVFELACLASSISVALLSAGEHYLGKMTHLSRITVGL